MAMSVVLARCSVRAGVSVIAETAGGSCRSCCTSYEHRSANLGRVDYERQPLLRANTSSLDPGYRLLRERDRCGRYLVSAGNRLTEPTYRNFPGR